MTTFNDYDQNTHQIEFDAPLSAEVAPGGITEKKHFSIDLSLELERQLEHMESPPITPAHDVTASETRQKHEALDPEILAHIVMQLRHSLLEVTKERDELVKMLATANAEEASAKDALQLMTDKATQMDEELKETRKQVKEHEEAIVCLRAKVEESRRGVMRLQTENRRQSMAPLDLSRTVSLSAFAGPPSSKRASFTPLTGTSAGRPGHRRISSISDTTQGGFLSPNLDQPPSPNPQTPAFPPDTALPPNSRRYSGLFGRQSPPQVDMPDPTTAELETLRKELKAVKDELDASQVELTEANEAKEASDTCVKALREFIAENNIGASVKLPLPPPTANGDEVGTGKASAVGWGFKLWGGGVDSPLKSSTATPINPASVASPCTTSTPTLPATAPLSRKLGGFFGSRGSVSSTHSMSPSLPALQPNTVRDSTYSFSDTSSVTEPVSPGSDIHGLGTHIVVRDVTNLSDAGSETRSLKIELR
ncbi:uncharacterized protein LACBIDRAFT_302762 [Laccaria bicolor S238N-H82]|uniref:Predicted protein n=1 Tax=Laccaria bicolor (strain S238N-H82 / ATCC MYA-4686) TaxID=486041 RepID=B0DI88_LACBS|nr:uncharacterized protein LACBIDRAFT_302762 [Laccaria bicolor S238N-H82]EDR05638.1 predicted protein [Laccaria bicolor S238N-H82]|eukprot:XP_001883742.1 predicted protein [Laccaria bicolor S238N-H82]